MSFSIDQAFVRQFGSNVFIQSQQQQSLLRPTVRRETQQGEFRHFERIGPTNVQERLTRHDDTPLISTPHSRRTVGLRDFRWADLIDQPDMVKTLIDPTNPYVQNAAMSFGRKIDEIIRDAALGAAKAGKSGETNVSLPNSQKIVSVNSSGAGAPLNVQALRVAATKLKENHVSKMNKWYFVTDARGIESLLEQTEVTSSDFNTVRALVNGEINEFLGFTFVTYEDILEQDGALSFVNTAAAKGRTVGSGDGDADGYRRYFAYSESGLIQSTGMDIISRVSERDDKNYSAQAFMQMSVGAVRMEEEQVVEVLANM